MISIHVPSWGTTEIGRENFDSIHISIHVPSWGTTRSSALFHCPSFLFQSTFPRGERQSIFWKKDSFTDISIHVPSWGTTSLPERNLSPQIHFNPRSLVGNDKISFHLNLVFLYFNPRSLVGNDSSTNVLKIKSKAFQSTFPRGERQFTLEAVTSGNNFNPRSLVGNDDFFRDVHTLHCDFNPRSLVGNDFNVIDQVRIRNSISIHVPSWGTTANFHKYSLFFYAINIIFLLFIIPSLFSLVLFMLLF